MKYSLLSLAILVLVLSFCSLLVSGYSFSPISNTDKKVCYRILGLENANEFSKASELGKELSLLNSSILVQEIPFNNTYWETEKLKFSESFSDANISSVFVIEGCGNNAAEYKYIGNLAEFETAVKGFKVKEEVKKEEGEEVKKEEGEEVKKEEEEEVKKEEEEEVKKEKSESNLSSRFQSIPEDSKNGNNSAVCYRILGIESTEEFEKGTKLGEELRLSNPNAYVVANCSYSQQNWDTKKPGFSKFLNKIDIPSLFVIEGCDNQDVKYVGDLTEFEALVKSATNDASLVFGSSLTVFVTAAVFLVLAVI